MSVAVRNIYKMSSFDIKMVCFVEEWHHTAKKWHTVYWEVKDNVEKGVIIAALMPPVPDNIAHPWAWNRTGDGPLECPTDQPSLCKIIISMRLLDSIGSLMKSWSFSMHAMLPTINPPCASVIALPGQWVAVDKGLRASNCCMTQAALPAIEGPANISPPYLHGWTFLLRVWEQRQLVILPTASLHMGCWDASGGTSCLLIRTANGYTYIIICDTLYHIPMMPAVQWIWPQMKSKKSTFINRCRSKFSYSYLNVHRVKE